MTTHYDFPLFDSHLHLDLKERTPLASLLFLMDKEGLEKGTLILNMPEERNSFFREIKIFNDNKDRFIVLAGINVHDKTSISDFDKMSDYGCNPGIKIHPRLFELSLKDLPWYLSFCERHPKVPIMVDTLFYGEMIEHHIGIEFGVYMARHFADRKIIMAHSGSLDFLKCMMATRYLDNVYYDYSFIQSYFKNTSIKLDMVYFLKRTSFRIMYGSDFPSFKLSDCINDFEELIYEASLNAKQIRDVFYNNAKSVYCKVFTE